MFPVPTREASPTANAWKDEIRRPRPARPLGPGLRTAVRLESVAVTLLSVFARQLAERGIQTVVTDPRLRGLFGDQVPEYASLAGTPLPLCRI
jgi:hypothetical protein